MSQVSRALSSRDVPQEWGGGKSWSPVPIPWDWGCSSFQPWAPLGARGLFQEFRGWSSWGDQSQMIKLGGSQPPVPEHKTRGKKHRNPLFSPREKLSEHQIHEDVESLSFEIHGQGCCRGFTGSTGRGLWGHWAGDALGFSCSSWICSDSQGQGWQQTQQEILGRDVAQLGSTGNFSRSRRARWFPPNPGYSTIPRVYCC